MSDDAINAGTLRVSIAALERLLKLPHGHRIVNFCQASESRRTEIDFVIVGPQMPEINNGELAPLVDAVLCEDKPFAEFSVRQE